MTARFHIKENGILDRSRNDKRLNPVELCNTLNALDCIADKNVDEYEYIKRLECENEQLKQQLLYDGDDVCSICKHEYLVPSGDYFIGKCKKGHKECSKEDIKYCEDFEKELR